MKRLHGRGLLTKIVDALGPPSRFARGLNGRQKQSDQNADDRDDDKQFDERERSAVRLPGTRIRKCAASARIARAPRLATLPKHRPVPQKSVGPPRQFTKAPLSLRGNVTFPPD